MDVLLALRRAVLAWPALAPLLSAEVPAVEAGVCSWRPFRATAGHRKVGELTVAQDAVRLAAGVVDGAVLERLAEGAGRSEEALAAAPRAWREGGVDGLAVWDEEWSVSGEALARARAAWEADERPVLRVSRRAGGRSSEAVPSCVWGATGRWWPYRREQERWVPAGGPSRDPATALASRAVPRDDEARWGVRAERWAGRTVRVLGPPTA